MAWIGLNGRKVRGEICGEGKWRCGKAEEAVTGKWGVDNMKDGNQIGGSNNVLGAEKRQQVVVAGNVERERGFIDC